MTALDPRIEAVRTQYNLAASDFWQIPQNGQWVCKHAALEVVAAKAGISFDMPMIIERNAEGLVTSLVVQGVMGDRREWATGETNPTNYSVKGKQPAYPWAMAEKRAKDRVILKLTGIHGLVYSDNEVETGETSPAVGMAQISSYRAKQLLKTDVLLAEIDGAKTLKRCDELDELFVTDLAFLPTPWVKQFRDRIVQQRETLGKTAEAANDAAVSANESLDQQFRETMRA
jgi:hypothetical protein